MTVVALGRMVHLAPKRPRRRWPADGIVCEIVDPRTTSPLDEETILESVENTGRLVVVDEANPRCGFAADVIALVTTRAFGDLKAPPKMVTPPHTPVPFSPVLEDAYVPTPDTIAKAIRATTGAPRAGMIEKLGMPKWGLSMTEGRLVDWLVDEGAEIARRRRGRRGRDGEDQRRRRGAGGGRAAPARGPVGDVIPVGGLLGVIADASVADAEIDAFVAEFEATFVPGEARRTRAPRRRWPATLRFLAPGRGRRAARAAARLRRRPQQLAVQRRRRWPASARSTRSTCRATAARQGVARRPGSADAVQRVPRRAGDRARAPRRALAGRAGRGRVRGRGAPGPRVLADPDRARGPRPGDRPATTSTGSCGDRVAARAQAGAAAAVRRPALVTRPLVDDVLKYKRLDGVEARCERCATAVPGRPRRRGRSTSTAYDRPVLVIWGAEDRDHPGRPRRGAPRGRTSRARRRRPLAAHGGRRRGQPAARRSSWPACAPADGRRGPDVATEDDDRRAAAGARDYDGAERADRELGEKVDTEEDADLLRGLDIDRRRARRGLRRASPRVGAWPHGSSSALAVTGGARGIGRGIALRLAADGLDVAVADLPSMRAETDGGRRRGRGGLALDVDVARPGQVDAMVAAVVERLGSPGRDGGQRRHRAGRAAARRHAGGLRPADVGQPARRLPLLHRRRAADDRPGRRRARSSARRRSPPTRASACSATTRRRSSRCAG